MTDAYIIAAAATRFGRQPDVSEKQLARQVYLDVLTDAGWVTGDDIDIAYFGNCGMWVVGQGSVRGQVCFTPLVADGLFPERVPMVNVEGACATASMVLHMAARDVLSGQSRVALAVGVEKTFYPDRPELTARLYDGGIDRFDPHEWQDYYKAAGTAAGKPFEPGPGRTIFMDTYAMQACYHMKRYGTTQAQIAAAAAKNHAHSVHNAKAQYRKAMSVEEVLADKPISYPLTRSMCSPIGDGAAAAIVCTKDVLDGLPAEVRDRAVRIAAFQLSGGKDRTLDEDGLSRIAGDRAYARAGITPGHIDVAEVHDATAFCELYQAEMLRFCGEGEGGPFVESGAASVGGTLPINTSGGLVSKGHPVGATGLSMIYELVSQLRGETEQGRRVPGAEWALAENGGGVMGFDEAACAVTILHRDR